MTEETKVLNRKNTVEIVILEFRGKIKLKRDNKNEKSRSIKKK